MAKMGARAKCTEEVIKRAVQLKKGGAHNKDIAAALGIAESTFYAWCNSPKSKSQVDFSEGMKKAEADYKNALLAIVMKAGKEKDWKAAAWLLERKYPEEYARTDRIQAQVKSEASAKVEVEYFFDYGGEDDGE